MSKIEDAKKRLHEADADLADAFRRRMEAVCEITACEREKGMPVPSLSSSSVTCGGDDLVRGYYPLFARHVEGLGEQISHRIMDGIRVAYAGCPGAFAELAARRIYPDGHLVPTSDFRAAYETVERGECDCAVLPLENSYAGDVAQVMDLAYFGSLHIRGVYDIRVNQCLVGVPGATPDGVRQVISHPQALSQCAGYISAHGYLTREAENTAFAARYVAEQRDPALAAVCNKEAASLYGLDVLAEGINESSMNTTRFAVFCRAPEETQEDKRFMLAFTVRNEAGFLSRAIAVIGENGFNMRSLKSRPTKNLNWDYYFYVEGEGCIYTPAGEKLLAALGDVCSGLKVIGSFDEEITL